MTEKRLSKIYNDGNISSMDETYNGEPFFRKMFYYSKTPTDKEIRLVNAEIRIVKLLMEHPHPNIVKYFDVNDKYVDMEILTSENIRKCKVVEPMRRVKNFLQSLGIMYIDWKLDNIGRTLDGQYKLFDFDVSGLVDTRTKHWIIEPVHYYSYNQSIKRGAKTPREIDDMAFQRKIECLQKKTITHKSLPHRKKTKTRSKRRNSA
jgi:serine/threonine protein kinase